MDLDLLLISRCPPFPLYRGDRLIPHYLVRELWTRRYRIDLVAFYQNPTDLADIPLYERYFREIKLIPEPRRSLMSYRHRVRNPEARFPTRADDSWSPEMWHAIRDMMHHHAYDVVHLFGGVQVYEYLHLVRSLPNLIAPYESYSLWLERDLEQAARRLQRWQKQIAHRLASNFESWMYEGYDRVVVLTDRDARALKALNPHSPVIEIPNGVDLDYFSPTGYEPREPTLMFIGNYDYAPNLDAALRLVRDIFPQVKAKVPQAHLFIVGGNAPPELQAYASDSIEITGRVPDTRPYFEYSLIFVSPLRLGAGIKNKVLEAMAMTTPVVATPLSCDGIPVKHGTHILLGDSDEQLIKNIFILFKNPQLRHQIAANALHLIEEGFTWQRVADLYEDLYQRVISERRRHTPSSSLYQ